MVDRNFLLKATLDRVSAMRRDEAWIAERLSDSRTRFVPVWRDHNLILRRGQELEVATLCGPDCSRLAEIAGEIVLLGVEGETVYIAADLSHHEPDAFSGMIGEFEFADIRNSRLLLEDGAGAMLLQARGLMYWHRHNQFCANCGSPTKSSHAGYARKCANAGCGREHFPRLDPAVITLVTRQTPQGEVCLLVHKTEWAERRFATIAGFVEPGETLEEAVRREVQEEAGVKVIDVRYQGSQPWPFPASLMLAFRATADDERIEVDNDEVDEAIWLTRDEVVNAASQGIQVSRGGSISRWLVDGWLQEGGY
jgi:NAD+ diphosphatase